MRPNLPFLSVASNAILKPAGALKWKKQLVEDIRLLLPFTEAMKIARLTSLLFVVPCQLSPRLRHGRRLVLLSPKSNSKSVYSILCFGTGSPSSFPNFPNCSSPRKSALIFADYLRCHFSVSKLKALCSRARGYLSELH